VLAFFNPTLALAEAYQDDGTNVSGDSETFIACDGEIQTDRDDNAQTTQDGEIQTVQDIIVVTLPSNVPFWLKLPSHGWGIVGSNNFYISNNMEHPVTVALGSAHVTVSDREGFTVSDTRMLPDYGNNIFMELICTQGDISARYALSEAAVDTHVFFLEGGETASFRFGGAVNELGEKTWSENIVTVSIYFIIEYENHYEAPNGEDADTADDEDNNVCKDSDVVSDDSDIQTDEPEALDTDLEQELYESSNSEGGSSPDMDFDEGG
jgi:hypothetical protein